jgi:hypothetical protein
MHELKQAAVHVQAKEASNDEDFQIVAQYL